MRWSPTISSTKGIPGVKHLQKRPVHVIPVRHPSVSAGSNNQCQLQSKHLPAPNDQPPPERDLGRGKKVHPERSSIWRRIREWHVFCACMFFVRFKECPLSMTQDNTTCFLAGGLQVCNRPFHLRRNYLLTQLIACDITSMVHSSAIL